ncbi:hypothetical protein CEXT_433421 [Caerostris extrusa]|uniref:Uncharacterized protein n=1 Tax=Caerostris extrusa TaxID=172846 RepID=A0AAV4XUK6_CAEEX|nr:hypothetical protein CEXT_433421 [Caerostris extrusa]
MISFPHRNTGDVFCISIRDRLRIDRISKTQDRINQGKFLKLASLSPASSHFVSDDTTLCPDITARVGKNVYVIDIACPFEGSDSALTDSYEGNFVCLTVSNGLGTSIRHITGRRQCLIDDTPINHPFIY